MSSSSSRGLDAKSRADLQSLLRDVARAEGAESRAARRVGMFEQTGSPSPTKTINFDFKTTATVQQQNPEKQVSREKAGLEAQKEAVRWKDKGNIAFGEENFKAAVSYYSKAIEYDDKDPVFYANRAMAQLKLGHNEEVVRDCDVALSMDSSYVKVLLRRAAALRALGRLQQARIDLERALKLDPASKQAKSELATIATEESSQRNRTKSPSEPGKAPSIATSPAALSGPARVQSTPVILATTNPTQILSSPTHAAAPVPTPALIDSSPAHIKSPPTRSPLESPSAPLLSKSNGGGSLTLGRSPSLSSVDVGAIQHSPDQSARQVAAVAAIPTPATFSEFERLWINSFSDDQRYRLFSAIPPQSMGKLLGGAASTEQFCKLLSLLDSHFLRDEKKVEAQLILLSLKSLPRFDLNVMFLSEPEREAVRRVVASFDESEQVAELKMAYAL